MNHRPTFTRLEDSTAADWHTIGGEFRRFAAQLPDRIITHLRLLENDYGGFPVDRYTHCLQTATRALQDGRDEEYVVCALLHDIGDTLGSYNHADIAAAILQPFVSEDNHWMVKHHGVFQGYYFFQHIGLNRDMRDTFKAHPAFDQTAEFCAKYDNPAFDPKGETLPLAEFEPLLRRVMASPRQSLYKAASVVLTAGAAA